MLGQLTMVLHCGMQGQSLGGDVQIVRQLLNKRGRRKGFVVMCLPL